VGVGTVGLIESADAVFKNKDALEFKEILELPLELRGSTATKVKDLMHLRRGIVYSMKRLEIEEFPRGDECFKDAPLARQVSQAAAPSRPHISYERCSAGPSCRTGPHIVPPSARAKIASGTSKSASLTGMAVLCLRTGRDHLQGGHQRVRGVGLRLKAMGSPWSSSGRTRSSSSCSTWTQVVGVVARVRDCLGTPVPRRRQVRFVRSAVF